MLSLADVEDAQQRVNEIARHTPLERSTPFSDLTDAEVYMKLETFQRTGAFKIRGAANKIGTLSESDKQRGVVTASAGNHAQGVAMAATRAGVDSKIVMPEYAPVSKIKATRSYGGEVILDGVDYDDAQARAHEIERQEERKYVHAFNDERVMAGQGTLGLEVLEDLPAFDTIVVPIGGGGLISGIATAVKGHLDDVRVIGVQASGASSAAASVEDGEIRELDSVDTIADGIATRAIGEKSFEVIQQHVDEIVTVSDETIALAVTQLLERSKTLVEGAGAVPLAALLEGAFEYDSGERIVMTLCGGNIDLNTLTTIIIRGLVQMGRYLKIRTELKDRPGALQGLVNVITGFDANIYSVSHDRTSRDIAVNAADIELELETHDRDHAAEIVAKLEQNGYEIDILS
ncbi:MAG: L-threonine ammonia-lyase [uncultured archaeon A07HR60]|nr:MAG: L-threonine ammonia-lyase [uncultured archaeon A07HR60]